MAHFLKKKHSMPLGSPFHHALIVSKIYVGLNGIPELFTQMNLI